MNFQEKQKKICLDDLGICFDFSHFPLKLNWSLKRRAKRALLGLEDLQAGSIVNPDENQMVGHYWLRNPQLAPTNEITQYIENTWREIEKLTKKIKEGEILSPKGMRFNHLLQVGIGGSILGNQLLNECFPNEEMRCSFIDNTDFQGIERKLKQMSKEQVASTLVIVISKSGKTKETLNALLALKEFWQKLSLDFSKQAIAITSKASPLDQQASQENWLKRFYLRDWIGGRTSITSVSSILPASLLGMDIKAFLQGAKQMDDFCREKEVEKNPALLFACSWFLAGKGKGIKDMVILPYRDSLSSFGKYAQQLVMESLGKRKDLKGKVVEQGLSVYGNKGSSDQHSFLQQLQEGKNNFFAVFIQTYEQNNLLSYTIQNHLEDYLQACLYGTRNALKSNNRDSLLLSLETLNPSTLGAMIALFENTVSFYAHFIGINAYHQPAVEKGKKNALSFLQTLEKLRSINDPKPFELKEIAEKIGEVNEGRIFTCLQYLEKNKEIKSSKKDDKILPLFYFNQK